MERREDAFVARRNERSVNQASTIRVNLCRRVPTPSVEDGLTQNMHRHTYAR
jgi:hypothetical protein